MKRSSISLLFASIALLAGSGASAEAFIDFFGGYSYTDYSQAQVQISPVFVPCTANIPDPINGDPNHMKCSIEDPDRFVRGIGERSTFDSSITYGGRAGYWFGDWLGLAVDASYFETKLDADGFTQNAKVNVLPISALVLFRVPLLRDDDFPLGRMHPYAGAGPSVFLSKFDGTVSLSVLPLKGMPPADVVGRLESTNVHPGLGVVAGVDFGILPFLSVFTEYRYTFASPTFKDNVGGVTTSFRVPLRTHHFVGGVSFRF
jgi:opacity protein-like surface antigen